jgi:hypothetical protein
MYRLDRAAVLTVLFVFMTVSALGVVAATIDSVDERDGTSRIDIQDPAGPADDPSAERPENSDSQGSAAPSGQDSSINLVVCIHFLRTPQAILGILIGVAVVLSGIYRQFNAASALLAGTAIIPIVWGAYFLTTNCITNDNGGGLNGLPGGGTMQNMTGGPAAPPMPPALVAGLFGVLVLGSAVMLIRLTSEEETFEPVEEEPEQPATADFAAAAGRAADRIEEANVSVDNAVYRAWYEMTALLDLEAPETVAPVDFVDAAVEAGLDRDDVEELTELFNEVRYGEKSAEPREERALAILRTIEETYQNAGRDDGPEHDDDTPSEGDH